MSDKKENLMNKTIKEITFDLLKELVILNTDRPKDFLRKVREVNNSKDPEKIIALLPEELQEKYKEILMAIKNPVELGIRKYEQWRIMVKD